MKGAFVSGIGTDVGKTVVCAILAEALQADYWKPIQCGSLENSDSQIVRQLTSSHLVVHPETYKFKMPASPHAASEAEEIEIIPDSIRLPLSKRPIIVEGAGGLMVPLAKDFLVLDIIGQLGLPVVLVSRLYLGSINHTLLSVEVLKSRGIPVLGLIFNGTPTPASEDYILEYSALPFIGRISEESLIDANVVSSYAVKFKPRLLEILG